MHDVGEAAKKIYRAQLLSEPVENASSEAQLKNSENVLKELAEFREKDEPILIGAVFKFIRRADHILSKKDKLEVFCKKIIRKLIEND